ncbi:hypothetical protein VS067_01608 [Bordetella pertussis]|uniref:tetratricopeptide repeat protein n=1 Tax=Bordetella pertussis TaxID=520 RepID=UPI000EB1AEF1|nr:tetratricopeptide repeat protein [Bordetella pertussis]SPR41231.1 hypothetical protein VS067_01608 [Bordetella pertussis]
MDIDLSAFHFLRPWWLLAVPLAALLWWARRGERGAPGRDLRIAPALLPYLVLRTPGSRGPRPIDALALFLALGGVAAAGPAWQRDEPAYLDNVAPLIVALDLSASMDGADVPPTRLEAARRVLRDLAAERAGGTLLILTDGADRARMDAVRRQAQAARDMQVLVMAVGVNGIDTQALQELARAAGAALGSLTGGPDDQDWIALHAQAHFRAVQDAQSGPVHWKDAGYWLCWPLALLALLAVRRGWSVAWSAGVLVVAMAGMPQPARADALADAFLTADQQGRRAFEHGRYDAAARHFHDPNWKGRAAYQAGDYRAALAAFSTLPSAEGYFYVGNTQTRLHRYDAALAAYDRALALRPGWQPAVVNRGIVARLLAAMAQTQQDQPAEPPDRTIADRSAQAGKMSQAPVAQAGSEEAWLRNLTLSPARFLRSKFAVEDAAAGTRP